eukprot:3344133-Amphidinium_carterae.2
MSLQSAPAQHHMMNFLLGEISFARFGKECRKRENVFSSREGFNFIMFRWEVMQTKRKEDNIIVVVDV